MSDLKPCPFCGGEVTFGSVQDSTHYWYIGCENCDYTHFYFGTKKEVIEKWNTRPAEDVLNYDLKALNFIYNKQTEYWEAEIERLKAALKKIAYYRDLNPDMKANKFSSCAEDALRNLYCVMGDIANEALANAPDTGKVEKNQK